MAKVAESVESSSSQVHIAFSIIVPVYREEKKIPLLLGNIRETMQNISSSSYEIIFVNDGSDDDTLKILLEESKKDGNVSVVSYNSNKGKGYAVRQGMLRSRGDEVIFIDGDLGVSPSALTYCKDALKSYDIVIGSKAHPKSQIKCRSSRRLLSRLFNIMVRCVFGTTLKDTQTGLKGGKGDILRDIFSIMTVNRYAFDVEFLTIAALLNLSIKELPVIVNYSNGFKYCEIARMFIDMISILYRYRIRNKYKSKLNQIRNKQVKY